MSTTAANGLTVDEMTAEQLAAHRLAHVEEHLAEDRETLTRRRAMGIFGVATAGLVAAVATRGATSANAATAACTTLTPAKEEGPYFVEEKLNRSDITTDTKTGAAQVGMPLTFTCTLLNEDAGCAPLVGATVDVWMANPAGKYSDEASEGTSGTNWLRGYQVSDQNGNVTFKTIYPGWYSGLAVHIHARIRMFDSAGNTTYDFFTRLYFDDNLTKTVYTTAPYASRGNPTTTNATDRTYGSDGAACLLVLTGNNSSGYTGTHTFGLTVSGTATTGTTSSGSTTATTGTGSGSTSTTGAAADGSVGVTLVSTKMGRTAAGTRILRMNIKTTETATVVARIKRGSKTLRKRSVSNIAAGSHRYQMSIPSKWAGGRATLDLTVTDKAGNTKHLTKIVTIPKKRS